MKKLFIVFVFAFILQSAQSQLTKGNWLAGGSGSFSSMKNTYSNLNYSQASDVTDFKISPNLGYFFIDKFALGLRPTYSMEKEKINGRGGESTNIKRFEFGPFARYYFLPAEKQYNFLTEVSYQYGIYNFKPDKGNINTFSASAGPAIDFNESVSLEFLMGYYKRTENLKNSFKTEQKGLEIDLGFQIHLEKHKLHHHA